MVREKRRYLSGDAGKDTMMKGPTESLPQDTQQNESSMNEEDEE